jgi:hypothetical protein
VSGSYGDTEEFFFANRADFDAFMQDAGMRKCGAGIVDADGQLLDGCHRPAAVHQCSVARRRLFLLTGLAGLGSPQHPGVWSGPVPRRQRAGAARRAQAILAEPPAELASLDSEDLARLEEILTRLRAAGPDRTTR